jgi:hypothetical protein
VIPSTPQGSKMATDDFNPEEWFSNFSQIENV